MKATNSQLKEGDIIMKKTNSKYITGSNVKDVTVLPNFILEFLGIMDAHKGEDVALAHINRYLERCISIEDGECLVSEEFLKKARSEGAANLDIIENTSKEIPDLPGDIEAEHAWDVLENRRRASNKARAKDAVKTARSRLYEINEEIINGTSILDQRVAKIRKRAASKIDAYIKGVRAGGITSFAPDIAFSEIVVEKYYKKHKRDKAIAAVAAVSNYEED